MKTPQYRRNILWISSLIMAYGLMAWSLWWLEHSVPEANIHTFGDALWYALVTLTTVGYGDMYPVSWPGKLLGLVFVLGSVSVLGYLVGQINSYWQQRMESKKLGYDGTAFRGHVVLIGWNPFGRQVASQILKAGRQMAIITYQREQVDIIRAHYPQDQVFVLLSEAGNHELLRHARPDAATSVFLNIDDDTQSLVEILNLKRRFPQPEYIVAIRNSDLKETFRTAGVRYIISQNEIVSRLVASYVFEPEVAQMTEELMEVSTDDAEYDLIQVPVSGEHVFVASPYEEAFITLKRDYNAVLMGVSRADSKGMYQVHRNPEGDFTIQNGDYLLLMADGRAKKQLTRFFGAREGR